MYNRIYNDQHINVVRVELNSSYRPRGLRELSKEPAKTATSISRHETFTKNDRPHAVVRSETFILKYNDDSSDERVDYDTYLRSTKKNHRDDDKKVDDKSHYATYTRSKKKGNDSEKSLYINTDTFRKPDKNRSSLSQESENLNTKTFTKTDKPKRVESLIKRFDMSFWRRHKDQKEKSPSPSGSENIKRSKNIFNLITSGKKSTRDIGIECKIDEDRDYYGNMGARKNSMQSLSSEKKHRPLRSSQRHESGSNQKLTGIIKSSEPRLPYYEGPKKSTPSVPTPIRVEVGLLNVKKFASNSELSNRPIGIASPLPQARNRSLLKSEATRSYEGKRMGNLSQSYAPTRAQETSNFNRQNNDRLSFKEYREKLKAKNDNRRITDNSDDELRKSYQQSFFVPM